MPIIVEPGTALNYLQPSDDFTPGYLAITKDHYIISQRTLMQQWPRVYEAMRLGAIIAVERTDESVITQWNIAGNSHFQPWIKTGQLRWITGGDAPETITNLNTEHFLAATYGSGSEPIQDWPAERPYTFLFTSRKLRPHRRYLVSQLHQKGLLDHALWANHETLDSWGHPDFNRVYTRDSVPHQTLPQGYDPDPLPSWVDGVVVPKQYQHTWFSLVSETVHESDCSFRTEKIYRPIIAGHPFFVSAGAGYLHSLKELGFQTYDAWVDEIYDDIDDGQERMDALLNEVEWLCQQDLAEFWRETQSVRLYNQRRAQELHNSQHKTFNKQLKDFIYA